MDNRSVGECMAGLTLFFESRHVRYSACANDFASSFRVITHPLLSFEAMGVNEFLSRKGVGYVYYSIPYSDV